MNIFIIDKRPHECAKALCDLRLNKMILETAQLLCTAYRHWFPDRVEEYSEVIYKVTHENHPCSVWLRKDIGNYIWLLEYFECLYLEKVMRTNKPHLSYTKLRTMFYSDEIVNAINELDYATINFDFNCSGIYPSTGDVFDDYKLCLIQKWLQDNREPKLTLRGYPNFVTTDIPKERECFVPRMPGFAYDLYMREQLTNDPIWLKHYPEKQYA